MTDGRTVYFVILTDLSLEVVANGCYWNIPFRVGRGGLANRTKCRDGLGR